jgi:hypothetical protein
MFLISLSLHMTSIFIFCLIHVLHRKDHLFEVSKGQKSPVKSVLPIRDDFIPDPTDVLTGTQINKKR